MSEKPEVIIKQDPANGQKKIVIELYDIVDAKAIPRQIKMEKSRIHALDGVMRDIYYVPKEYRNHWIDLGYDDPIKILWDPGGHPYIDVAAKKKPERIIRVMLKEKDATDMLDLLLTAEDFCDYCKGPLNPNRLESQWLNYSDGGGTIANVIECQFCEKENIRWDKDFLDDHPVLARAGLKSR